MASQSPSNLLETPLLRQLYSLRLYKFTESSPTLYLPCIVRKAAFEQIREAIVLSRDGTSYNGSFTLDAYDTSGNNIAHIVGKISATRITVSTSACSAM